MQSYRGSRISRRSVSVRGDDRYFSMTASRIGESDPEIAVKPRFVTPPLTRNETDPVFRPAVVQWRKTENIIRINPETVLVNSGAFRRL